MESKSNLQFVSVIDPRVNLPSSSSKYGVYRSGTSSTYRTVQSTTFDNSQISWVFSPPSNDTFMAKRVLCRMSFDITFTGTSLAPGFPLLQCAGLQSSPGVDVGTAYLDAPRCFPLTEAFRTLSVQLNNDNVSSNIGSYSRIFSRYARNADEENKEYSLTPSMSDKSQSYDDLIGFPLNPLSNYGDNTNQNPRGSFSGCTVLRNDSTGLPGDIAIVRLTVTEPLFLSPLSFSRELDKEISLIGISNVSVTATLGSRGSGLLTGLAASLWSHAPSGSVLSSIQAEVKSGSLLVSYLSPDKMQTIPRTLTYNYFEPVLYVSATSTPIAPGASVTINMNSVQLPSIPGRIYIFASERDQNVNVTSTNSYMRLDNINITFGNRDSLLANMTPEDLYLTSVSNGCNLSFDQFRRHIGSVLCLSLGKDIPLSELEAPGMRSQVNLQITGTFTNISSLPIIPSLNVLVCSEGVMTIDNGSVSRSIGVLSVQDVLDARSQTPMSYTPGANFYGNGFMDDIGDWLKKAARTAINVAGKVVPILAPEFSPLVSAADQGAKAFGFGLRKKGSALMGGALLSKSEMKRLTY